MRGTTTGADILTQIAGVCEPSAIPTVFQAVRDHYGVENLVYHAVNVRGLTRDGAFLKLTYPEDWIARYYARDYFKIDPVVEEGARAFLPFLWSDLDWSGKRRQEFAEDAAAHSIGMRGLTIPIRGPDGQHALFSLSTSRSEVEWKQQMREQLPELHNLAHHIHQATIRAEGVSPPLETITLSDRQRDVLQWAAAGKTSDEIALILGIAERTVRVYLDTSRYKLSATNRTHAVARALSLGLINPPD